MVPGRYSRENKPGVVLKDCVELDCVCGIVRGLRAYELHDGAVS